MIHVLAICWKNEKNQTATNFVISISAGPRCNLVILLSTSVCFSYFSEAEIENFLLFSGLSWCHSSDEATSLGAAAFTPSLLWGRERSVLHCLHLDSLCFFPPFLGFCPTSYPLLDVLQSLTIHGLLSISQKPSMPHLFKMKPNLLDFMSPSR